jgi:hypothetical protein
MGSEALLNGVGYVGYVGSFRLLSRFGNLASALPA